MPREEDLDIAQLKSKSYQNNNIVYLDYFSRNGQIKKPMRKNMVKPSSSKVIYI